MSTARQLRFSYEDYLRALDDSDLKLEYCAGVIYAMAGGTLVHAELSASIISVLRAKLPATCSVLSSDAKIRIETSDFSGFPDASVVCGDKQTARIDAHALTNPALVVEVTSRSTEDYDRGEKLLHYQRIPSLRAVLFISHRERRITLWQRSGSDWKASELASGQTVIVTEPPMQFEVDEVYRTIALEP